MAERILVDAGPLVAILSRNDQHHQRCVEVLAGIPRAQPLLTCRPVLTEAAWLVRKQRGGIQRLLQMVEQRVVGLLTLDRKHFTVYRVAHKQPLRLLPEP